jgi:hypothetical protein
MARRSDPPVVLVKWYDFTKWVLGHVDNFPKNQRFVFGQRLADGVLAILELNEVLCPWQMSLPTPRNSGWVIDGSPRYRRLAARAV